MASFCGQCGFPLKPGARFCGRCGSVLVASGVATAVRPPVPVPSYPAVSHLAPAPVAGATRKRAFPWLIVGGGVAGLIVVFTVISLLLVPKEIGTCGGTVICPHPPPNRPPLANPHTYTSQAFQYKLDYFDQGPLSEGGQATNPSLQNAASVGWALEANGVVYPITFTGENANHRSAQLVVQQIQARSYPNATLAYTIPGAEMGYNDGYGNVYDIKFAAAGAQSARRRLIIIAAVKNGLAVELVSIGPYKPSKSGAGHPNPANTPIVNYFDDIVNTVRFPGDPPL